MRSKHSMQTLVSPATASCFPYSTQHRTAYSAVCQACVEWRRQYYHNERNDGESCRCSRELYAKNYLSAVDDVPINYELGLRVQALESLIRSGSNMDAESASTAAMETILHATRAANSGSQEANNALSQLTQSGIGTMSQDAQSILLMDVLQQVGKSVSNCDQLG